MTMWLGVELSVILAWNPVQKGIFANFGLNNKLETGQFLQYQHFIRHCIIPRCEAWYYCSVIILVLWRLKVDIFLWSTPEKWLNMHKLWNYVSLYVICKYSKPFLINECSSMLPLPPLLNLKWINYYIFKHTRATISLCCLLFMLTCEHIMGIYQFITIF